MTLVRKEIQFGEQQLVLETGKIAKQATGSVMITIGDSMVLTVNYQEKTYAAGKIPGGFFRREGRPSEKETLTSRLIDRPLRPLFPKGFLNEVQVICTVMSAGKDEDPDILDVDLNILNEASEILTDLIDLKNKPLLASNKGKI